MKIRETNCGDTHPSVETLRNENRLNAKLTRKRRRIYDEYLNALLEDLVILLAAEIQLFTFDENSGFWNISKVRTGAAHSRLTGDSPEKSLGNLGLTPLSIFSSRALSYFKARLSTTYAQQAAWNDLCVNDIYQSFMPCPIHIYMNGKGQAGSLYVSRSVNEVIEDAMLRSNMARMVMYSSFRCMITF